jgi:hypothetical protein
MIVARWQVAMAGALVLLAAVAAIYGSGRRDGRAAERPKVAAARAEAVVGRLETRGARDAAQRVEIVVRQREVAATGAARVMIEALKAEDADAPLDPARADRLRAHDLQLCDAAPDLLGCAAGRDARGGDPPL